MIRVYLGWDFRKLLSYLKAAPSNLPNWKFFWRNKNALFKDFWPKLAYLDIFGLEFFKKTYCHIWNKHPCLIAKYREIMKTPKFATKIALFGYFWARSLEKLLSYLKSAPSKLPICKITRKAKIPKFGTKNALFGYFWARILKKLLSYLKSAPSN